MKIGFLLTTLTITILAQTDMELQYSLGGAAPSAVSYSRDGESLLVAYRDTVESYLRNAEGKFILLYNSTSQARWSDIKSINNGTVEAIFDRQGELKIVQNKTIDLKDLQSDRFTDFGGSFPTCMAVTDDSRILVGLYDGRVQVYAPKGTEYALSHYITTSHKTILQLSASANQMVTCGYERFVEVHSTDFGRVVQPQTVTGLGTQDFSACSSIDMTATGEQIAVSKMDDQVYLLRKGANGQYQIQSRFRPLREHHSATVKWSSHGNGLFVVNDHAEVSFWAWKNGQFLKAASRQGKYLMAADWSEIYQELAVATESGVEFIRIVPGSDTTGIDIKFTDERKRPFHITRAKNQ